MLSKKTPNANLENKRSIALLLGLVLALSVVYISLEWSKSTIDVYVPIDLPELPEDIPDIPQTAELKPPPPPPPVQPPVIIDLKPVDNDIDTDPIELIGPEDDPNDPVNVLPPIKIDEDDSDIIVDFLPSEFMPKFPGNLNEFLSRNIRYPVIAQENNIQGRVTCQFVINKNGEIIDAKVIKGVDPSLDREALRIIKSMPNWSPGIQQGKPVSVKYTLPINFRLQR